VRYDGGSYEGWEVPIHYDPLLAKLCVWAETREAAITRLARVLGEYRVEGIRTSLPFFRAVVEDEEFRRGEFDTGFIDRFLSRQAGARREVAEADETLREIAAIAAVLHAKEDAGKTVAASPQSTESRWKLHARLSQRKS
jgi:acetyl/propionyl-CoA carboxylase alpha subunit